MTRLMLEEVMLLMVFLPIVFAQTGPLCPANSITILDKTTGKHECVDCLTCPEGQGLTVHCGDVITPQTSISCKPCVLGETYSAANQPGACKECENCDEYQETTKACTLTSKAQCGKCKVGAYPDNLLPKCVPCSPCCNDGNDVLIGACQVRGVPKAMRCSYARSEKCRKVAGNVSPKPSQSSSPSREIRPSTVTRSTLYPTATKITAQGIRVGEEPKLQYREKELKSGHTRNAGTAPKVIAGGVGGGVGLAVVVIIGLLVWRYKLRRKNAFETANEAVVKDEERATANQQREEVQDKNNGNEKDPLKPVVDLPPVQEIGGSQTQLATGVQESGRKSDFLDYEDVNHSSICQEQHPLTSKKNCTHPVIKKTTVVKTTAFKVPDYEGEADGV